VSVLRQGTNGGDECWAAIEGALDARTSLDLGVQLRALMQSGCRRLIVDLSRTDVIGSTGVRVLLDAMRAMEGLGGALVLRAPAAEVYELGRVRRLAELLAAMDEAVEEADAIHRLDRLFS